MQTPCCRPLYLPTGPEEVGAYLLREHQRMLAQGVIVVIREYQRGFVGAVHALWLEYGD